jgi:hypothetical protein
MVAEQEEVEEEAVDMALVLEDNVFVLVVVIPHNTQ